MRRSITTALTRFRFLLVLPLVFVMSGCDAVVLHPAGDVAAQERDLLIFSTLLMLLIIVPVMALTIFFAWKYRQSNSKAVYHPDWDHSTILELVIWAAPLFIIIALGALTWMGTHLLDPYRALGRINTGHDMTTAGKPLQVDAIALDWKWLFIYPEYGIASVNELAAPVDRPIDFHITASSVMNSFYVPALAGQIYAMPGMETRLKAVINNPGTYKGISANYSGAGFSGMHFLFHGMSDSDFAAWTKNAKSANGNLTANAYLDLAKPSENDSIRHYSHVDTDLYQKIVGMCVEPGTHCMTMSSMSKTSGIHELHDESKARSLP